MLGLRVPAVWPLAKLAPGKRGDWQMDGRIHPRSQDQGDSSVVIQVSAGEQGCQTVINDGIHAHVEVLLKEVRS